MGKVTLVQLMVMRQLQCVIPKCVCEKITQALLTDLDKETVNFSPNYDGELMIPDVLPTRIPALLANGSSGIAVGMATNIPLTT